MRLLKKCVIGAIVVVFYVVLFILIDMLSNGFISSGFAKYISMIVTTAAIVFTFDYILKRVNLSKKD